MRTTWPQTGIEVAQYDRRAIAHHLRQISRAFEPSSVFYGRFGVQRWLLLLVLQCVFMVHPPPRCVGSASRVADEAGGAALSSSSNPPGGLDGLPPHIHVMAWFRWRCTRMPRFGWYCVESCLMCPTLAARLVLVGHDLQRRLNGHDRQQRLNRHRCQQQSNGSNCQQ